jgi:hypothetical protein
MKKGKALGKNSRVDGWLWRQKEVKNSATHAEKENRAAD